MTPNGTAGLAANSFTDYSNTNIIPGLGFNTGGINLNGARKTIANVNGADTEYLQGQSVLSPAEQEQYVNSTVLKQPGTTTETSWWDSLKNSFNPEGTSGRSYAGNVMDAAGTAFGIGTGLAGAYYTKKNYDLQKEQQEYLKNREAQSDARKSAFAANIGGGASY